MKIQYKFKKSSEARDCIVESVELEIPEILHTEVKELSKEEIIEILMNEFDDKVEIDLTGDISSIIEKFLYELLDYDFEQYEYDLYESYESGTGIMNLEKSNSEITFDVRRGRYGKDVSHVKGVIKTVKVLKQTENKQFTSSQQLKDYINTIQEPIEFITESDIDQVLMKEWIGEWNHNEIIEKVYNVNSPKLNNNWTFKIN